MREIEVMRKIESRGLIYKILSTGFDYPKDRLINALPHEEYWNALVETLDILDERLSDRTREQSGKIRSEARDGGLAAFEVEYNRLFQVSHVNPCPLTASEYMKGESRQALAVAQLRGIYRSFGVNTRPNREADHICTLLEFMSWLCAKEARAHTTGNEEGKVSSAGAQIIVIGDYLGFVPLMAQPVCEHAEMEYYRWLVNLAVDFMRLEREALLPQATFSA